MDRRQFLSTSGAALAVPLLTSASPAAAFTFAQAPAAGSGAKPMTGGTGGAGQGPTMMNAGAGGASAGAGGSTAGSGALAVPTAGNTGATPRATNEQTKDDTAGLCSVSDVSRRRGHGAWWTLALPWLLARRKR